MTHYITLPEYTIKEAKPHHFIVTKPNMPYEMTRFEVEPRHHNVVHIVRYVDTFLHLPQRDLRQVIQANSLYRMVHHTKRQHFVFRFIVFPQELTKDPNTEVETAVITVPYKTLPNDLTQYVNDAETLRKVLTNTTDNILEHNTLTFESMRLKLIQFTDFTKTIPITEV